jgi:acyl carrier protein
MTLNEVTQFITEFISHKSGLAPTSIDKNANIIETGLVDSIDFIALIMKLESELNLDLDFTDLEPEAFTHIAGLAQIALNKASVS